MTMKTKDKSEQTIEILRIKKGVIKLYLLGTTPLIMNRLTKKVWEYLLLPPRKKNRAALEAVQKHNPPEEFRDSIYRCRDQNAPTLVHAPTGALKGALASAALRLPGATKTEIVSIIDATVHVYGIPYLYMAPVRQAGPSKTPDIRTRAIFPEWALEVEIGYITDLITSSNVINLAAAAGMIVGVGDGRMEKGKFDFGSWDLVSADDKRWRDIVAKQGRKAQVAAMQNPVAFDTDSEELLAWYEEEIKRREQDKASNKATPTVAAHHGDKRRNGRGREKTQ
jgi:hypothetical protein